MLLLLLLLCSFRVHVRHVNETHEERSFFTVSLAIMPWFAFAEQDIRYLHIKPARSCT